MSLKDQIADDIENVFLNTDEFATTHVINGITMPCVVNDDLLLERSDAAAQGVYLGEKLIFINASLLPGKPAIGGRFTFDGKPYTVINVVENMGMFELRLKANKT